MTLQTHCASGKLNHCENYVAIFKCAADAEVRNIVRQCNGLAPLVLLLDGSNKKDLLAAATGAVWKCAQSSNLI